MLHSQESKLKRLLNSHSMYKYDGLLIHQDYDDNGALEVVEANGVRSLHFGSSPRQSSMLLRIQSKITSRISNDLKRHDNSILEDEHQKQCPSF
ncbi:hypothetical protein LBMAG43_14990 [Methylococcaceae bacterium]|nr:hypothetical protein LBMAG43_14990 [Methylococcaceae bacterium]